MFGCPSCGANLRYDIAAKDLGCAHCGNHFDVYSFDENKGNAEEHNEFDATAFLCPQCGAELVSADEEAAVFCSYCGASNILDKRIKRIERPKYIIPFKLTKEQCKEVFVKHIRSTGFAPKHLTEDSIIESFRGIYMPYWEYDVTQKGSINLQGEKTHRKGDYIIHDHYSVAGQLDASYAGFSKDASAGFEDDISDAIAPFDISEAAEFTPAYLSGFYADGANVDHKKYDNDARELAFRNTLSELKTDNQINVTLETNKINQNTLNTQISRLDSVMYPVWFLSYRDGDRIGYASINGQTGKVAADVPISKGKYFTTSLIMMIPLYLLFDLFITMTPKWLLTIATILNVVALLCHVANIYEMVNNRKGVKNPKSKWVNTFSIISIVVGVIIWFVSPTSDIIFYGVSLVILICILLCIIDIIANYNTLSTRPLPQFVRTGGDDRA